MPTIEVVATEDPVSGWNIQLITTDFAFAPQRAGREFVLGEGHGHLYVDGQKRDRLYGSWYHLDNLAPGDHRIEVTLNGNNHAVYQSGGRSVSDETNVRVDEQTHTHPAEAALEAGPDMEVVLRVEEDPLSGWNVFIDTSGFAWAPAAAGFDPVPGEGHAHLHVDDQKIGRLYGPSAYLAPLGPGLHTVTVSLHGNNHAPYVKAGKALAASATIEEQTEAEDTSKRVALEVRDGEVVGGVQQVEVTRGDNLELVVTADQAETLHIHGYDITRALQEGIETSVTLHANIPGVFEIELEDGGLLLMYLTVR